MSAVPSRVSLFDKVPFFSSSTGNPTSKQSSESGGKTFFAGFKASKLAGVTQSLFGTETKKEGDTATPITWAAPVTATAPAVAAKDDSPAEKVKYLFLLYLFPV